MPDTDIPDRQVDIKRQRLHEAQDHKRNAEWALDLARAGLIEALANRSGLKLGDKITVQTYGRGRPRVRSTIDSFALNGMGQLAIYHRRVKNNGEPYADAGSCPVTTWTVGWGE
ncbi:MAG: hypothetical protein GY925_23705 [Actinomycetia bacterium]|nr:hypothetical protein [Actinomycetes bacterium]